MPIDRVKISELSQEKVLNLINDLASKVSDEYPVFEGPPTLPAGGIVFPDGSQTGEAVASRTSIIRKTATYTLSSLQERDCSIQMESITPIALIIPADAMVDFPIGTSLDIVQTGYGQVNILPYPVTTAVYSSGGASGGTTLTISAENLNIEPGQEISGTGIYAGTLVVNVNGATITVDTPFEGQVSGNLTLKVGIVGTPSLKLRAKWSSATIFKKAKNSWVAFGDLALTESGLPSTPSAPVVRSQVGNENDYVTIFAPISDGGSAITSYSWESSDGKSGTRSAPGEFAVAQEAGTTQTYRVRAVNGVGTSAWSANSPSIITTFSFAPTFSFTPSPPPPDPCNCCSYDMFGNLICSYCYICSSAGCFCNDDT
jgi:hypothetical protein